MNPCHKTPVLVTQTEIIPARHHTTLAMEHFPQRTCMISHRLTSAVSICVRHTQHHNPKLPSWKGYIEKAMYGHHICYNLAVGAKPSVEKKAGSCHFVGSPMCMITHSKTCSAILSSRTQPPTILARPNLKSDARTSSFWT